MPRPLTRTGLVALAVTLLLTGCGSGGGPEEATGEGAVSPADVRAALDKGGTLTVWAWEPTLKAVVTEFTTKYPKVKINLVNAGTGNDQYTGLQNAIAAGKGVPDVAQIEYYALPQFALARSVTDLTAYGAGSLKDTFTPGPWSSVRSGAGIYGLPMDSGPMALFYNKEIFDRYGVAVPTTWPAYLEAARQLHQANPELYLTNDTGDAGFTTSMIWQAGGRPYRVDGSKVTIDFSDEGTQRFTGIWQQLISEKLLAPVTSWSDQWYQGLAGGSIASLAIGAWMPANLSSGAPAGAGKWRVAPLPQWPAANAASGTASAENGGSSLAIPTKGMSKALAYGFISYANAGAGVRIRVDGGAFPATVEQMGSQRFLDTEFAYFGGQKANRIFADSAKNVVPGWSYLPFQVYANSVFHDTVGKAYVSDTPLRDGLASWQQKSKKYGKEQGFTVK